MKHWLYKFQILFVWKEWPNRVGEKRKINRNSQKTLPKGVSRPSSSWIQYSESRSENSSEAKKIGLLHLRVNAKKTKGTTKVLMTLKKKKKGKINFQCEDCSRKNLLEVKSNFNRQNYWLWKKDGNRVSEAPDLGNWRRLQRQLYFSNSLRCEQLKEPPTLQLPLRKLISAEVT